MVVQRVTVNNLQYIHIKKELYYSEMVIEWVIKGPISVTLSSSLTQKTPDSDQQ